MSDPARVPTPHAGSDALTHERALRPSSRSIALSVLAVGAASAIWTLGLPAVGIGVSPWLAELGQGLANGALQAIGCVLVLRGAAVQTGRRRVAWMTIGMGALAGTIGTAVWSFVLATTGEHPEQALIDGLYALALFLTTLGVALLPPTALRSRLVRPVAPATGLLLPIPPPCSPPASSGLEPLWHAPAAPHTRDRRSFTATRRGLDTPPAQPAGRRSADTAKPHPPERLSPAQSIPGLAQPNCGFGPGATN